MKNLHVHVPRKHMMIMIGRYTPFKPGSSSLDLIFFILTVLPLSVANISLCLK